MYSKEDHKDLSKLNKLGQFFIKAILVLLGIDILLTIVLSVFDFSFGREYMLAPRIIELILISSIFYLIYKKNIVGFYILAVVSLVSFSNTIQTISQTGGISIFSWIDVISLLFVMFASAYIIYKTKLHKSKFVDAIKNLDKKEVVFWGPVIFFITIIAIISIIYTFFIPALGYYNEIPLSMFNLFKIHFSVFPILLLVSMILCIYSIIKKSFLRTYISIILLAVFLLISLDTYQKFVGKPYLDAVTYIAIIGIILIMIFVVGLFILVAALMNKDYFKLSKY